MKKLIYTLFAIFFCTTVFGQSAPNLVIRGLVADSVTLQPIGYVTVALQDAANKTPVKSILAKEDGSFELTAAAGKTYNLVLANLGYNNKQVAVTGTAPNINMGRIVMSASLKQLAGVTITGTKPLMKQEVDRLSYDVSADPESKSITALDIMRKVPLLSVDANDNIKLRGSGDYKILINGKESALMARNPSDILKAMPASNIVKIEVITTPPAKYDAEGLAGIINIITTKKTDQGYNGNATVNYNSVYGYRGNLNLTIKQGKFGFSGYGGYGKRPQSASAVGAESTFTNPASSLIQDGTQSRGGNNTYTNDELSFEADSLNLINATFNHYNGANTSNNDQLATQRDGNNNITQAYHLSNNGIGNYTGTDMGINYQLGFKHNKDQLLTASYRYNSYNNDNNTDNRFTNYNRPNYQQYNNSGGKEYTTQLDYIQPSKILTIEAGGKMILRNNYSNFRNDTLATNGQYQTVPSQTNDFTYHQNVYSVYNSYQVKLTSWSFKAGLRFERTNINAEFAAGGGMNFGQSYNNLVPSLSIMRTINTTNSVNFGFTQRIQRPGIWQLNPFVDSSNPNYVSVGNPALRPAINNNFEFNYSNSAKGSLNISTHYSFVNNTIQSIITVNNGITTTTYANVGSNRNLGIDLNLHYPITPKLNININSAILQVWLKGTYNGGLYTNSGQQGHIFTDADYKFDDGFRIATNVGFDSRYVLLEGRDNYYFGNSYSASKDIFNKKVTISLYLNNPWAKFNKIDFYTKSSDFSTYNYFNNYYRTVGFNLMYKFGKLNSQIKKNQHGINNDDTTSGRN
ncbi:MAG TPA: TonB-dependent receptor [Mucilaginibacter sp.]|jgi:outer membrane receptor protein involved in Fe transport|nr:TonB-dependent receptor [Mucilaginibacter sp.]